MMCEYSLNIKLLSHAFIAIATYHYISQTYPATFTINVCFGLNQNYSETSFSDNLILTPSL